MAITRQSFADDTASLLQQTYQQKWLPTNWESSAAPKLPAGMTIYIGGVPYVVDTEDYTLGGSPSDGTCYIKITPNSGDGGATADAVLTNTFSGTWNEAWNDFYDSTAIFLNFFCTKATTNYTEKGQWLNYRERKIQAFAGSVNADGNLVIGGNISAVNGVFSGDVAVNDITLSGQIKNKIDCPNGRKPNVLLTGSFDRGAVFNALDPYIPLIGDTIIVHGAMYLALSGVTYNFVFAVRDSSTQIIVGCYKSEGDHGYVGFTMPYSTTAGTLYYGMVVV